MFYPLLRKINDNCSRLIEIFSNYFSPDVNGDLFNPEWKDYLSFPSAGWINFWSSFTDTSLKDFVLDIVDEVEKQTNPLHADNQAEFDSALTNLKTNTFIGSIDTIANDTMPELLQHLNGSTSTFIFYTSGVSTDLYTIPSSKIVLNMSWYAPFKQYGDMIISGFMWLFYLIMMFRHLPDILNGAGLHFEGHSNVDEPVIRNDFVLDDNGTVLKHSTSVRYRDHTDTINHRV